MSRFAQAPRSSRAAALLWRCVFVVPLMKYHSCSPAHHHNPVLCLISHNHRGLVFTMPNPHLQPQDGVIASKSWRPSRAGMTWFLRDWIHPALTRHYIVRCADLQRSSEKRTDLAEITHSGSRERSRADPQVNSNQLIELLLLFTCPGTRRRATGEELFHPAAGNKCAIYP